MNNRNVRSKQEGTKRTLLKIRTKSHCFLKTSYMILRRSHDNRSTETIKAKIGTVFKSTSPSYLHTLWFSVFLTQDSQSKDHCVVFCLLLWLFKWLILRLLCASYLTALSPQSVPSLTVIAPNLHLGPRSQRNYCGFFLVTRS